MTPRSLKDARNQGDLEGFIKEHEKDKRGDLDKLEEVIRQPAQGLETASKARKTSRPRRHPTIEAILEFFDDSFGQCHVHRPFQLVARKAAGLLVKPRSIKGPGIT